ncbi:translation elongation factor Ts [bacterium]|nr:translation elongation factor Ts [bacterium]MBU1063762.1 translation elongation factor Ts [bacterium]MBU1635711.1 translation elongation factor Ts [bacterium]MBU1873760.1 translation elongation factor Ts [bacterium]
MEITAAQVKELRDRTGIGMMDCKGALVEAEGDIDKAIDILRKKGKAKAERKADREVKDGLIWSYIHPGNKLGVLIEVNCETDFVAKNEGFQEFVKDIAMHIAATNPAAIRREEIDMALIAKEREIYMVQARTQNKPDNILERIVDGKLDKYFQENCLLEQAFVKDPQKTIKDYLTETIARIGENINISRFVRFQLGENN